MNRTTISNLALDLLGHNQIDDINDNDKNSRTCKRWIDIVYSTFLRDFQLAQTVKKITLPKTVRNGVDSFAIPFTCEMILATDRDEWQVTGDYITVPGDSEDVILLVEYVENDFDGTNLKGEELLVLSTMLAINLAHSLRVEQNIISNLKDELSYQSESLRYNTNGYRRPLEIEQITNRYNFR